MVFLFSFYCPGKMEKYFENFLQKKGFSLKKGVYI